MYFATKFLVGPGFRVLSGFSSIISNVQTLALNLFNDFRCIRFLALPVFYWRRKRNPDTS